MARKRKAKGTTPRRNQKQRVLSRHRRALEDARLLDLIPMMPEDALKDERVDPASQGEQLITDIVIRAAKEDWATPDPIKRIVVAELAKVVASAAARPIEKVMASNALGKLDQIQFERDNPEVAGKAKGTASTNVNVGVTVVNPWDLYKRALEEVDDDGGRNDDAPRTNDAIAKADAVDGADAGGSTVGGAQEDSGPGQDVLAGGGVLRQRRGDGRVNGAQP